MIPRKIPNLLLVLFYFTFSTAFSEDTIFLTRPKTEPYYVKEGEEGPVLDCSFAAEYLNRTKYEPSWTAVIGEHPKHLTRNDVSFARDYYELLQNDARYSLRIKTVSFQRNNGKYYCTILDKENGSQESAQASVIVVVAPEKPQITKEPNGNVFENDLVSVECQSASGNPPPRFTWKFNNNTEVPKDWYQARPAVFPDKTSSSLLQWRVGPQDNNAYVTCEIWNEALPAGQHWDARTNPFDVQYSPRVNAGPVKDYNVEEGERAELTCTANGNPDPTKYEWRHINTGETYDGETWKFIAERSHSGSFTCTANNGKIGSDSLMLNVLYRPIVKAKEIVTPAEGESVTLECIVDANPAPDTIIWQMPSGTKHSGAHLTLDSVARLHSGNYTCMATNTLTVYGASAKSFIRTGQAVTLVDVLTRPGKATVRVSDEAAISGSQVILTCDVTDVGSPKARYRWSSTAQDGDYNGLEQNSNSIVIEHATLNNSGEYRCTPFNAIGEGEEGLILLEVIEPAKITSALPEKKMLSDNEKILACEAQGYPVPEIRWLKNGYDITDSDDSHWTITTEQHDEGCELSKYCVVSVSSQLRFVDSLMWNDKGVYTCLAKNGVEGVVSESSSRISVFHNPVILNERYPTDGLAAADDANTARIVCKVSALPPPKFEWLKGSDEIHSANGRYVIRETALAGKVDEFESVLEISDLVDTDYGLYLCRAIGNSGAKTEITIHLQAKSRPQLPRNVCVFLSAPDWILVGWQPGFNGGADQKFQFEYRKTNPWKDLPDGTEPVTFYTGSLNASTVVVYGEGKKLGMRVRRSMEPSTFMVYNITNLSPLSNYWLRVRARNNLGESDWTPIITASTSDVLENSQLPQPQSLVYKSNEKKVGYQRPEMSGLCLLLLVNSDDSADETNRGWRSVGCFADSPVSNIEPANRFRARFCLQQNISICSKAADIVVTATLLSSAWKYALPGAVIGLSFILLALTLLACCFLRRRSFCVKKNLKNGAIFEKRPEVSAPLPQSDGKNMVVHGSHSDSGIFTLGSVPNGHPVGQPNMGTSPENITSYDAGVNDWCSGDGGDFAGDPYIQEYGTQYMSAKDAFPGPPSLQSANFFYDGFPPCDGQPFNEQRSSLEGLPTTIYEDQEDSDEASCSISGGRRVMREIIV